MSLFKKLFGQEGTPASSNEPKSKQEIPCKTEQELLERFGGIAFEKQTNLADVIGQENWNVDMKKGEISFGANLSFPMQVLGTFAHASEGWLWAWANTKSGLSEAVTQQALQLKKYGEENGIGLLKNSEFDATNDDLHKIGLIASGMFDASGYYLANYGQGTMVLTMKSEKIDQLRKEDHLKILTTFPQLISQFDMQHKPALTNYLAAKGYAITENGSQLSATKNGNTITAEFDEQSRLAKLNG